MTPTVQQILDTFNQMPETERQELAAEILRRALSIDYGSLSDEELILNAEQVFLGLDQREALSEEA
ncbi:MAG TPA: hypothetical protein VE821_11965 [Pyrinomonadaceae bacterium]|nr:hypothetical protein [Pyrinomonadaceae bacterium]